MSAISTADIFQVLYLSHICEEMQVSRMCHLLLLCSICALIFDNWTIFL